MSNVKQLAQLSQLIEKTRPEYQDGKETVAFLGEVSSGKTVISAFLKYILSTSWIPKSKGRWEAVVSSGHDKINEIIRKMKNGTFPPPTPKKDYPKLVIDVYNMEGKPLKIELVLHDVSGENHVDLLTNPYNSEEERLIAILSGPGAYIAYAKRYVIMIDCAKKKDWDTDPAKVARMISSIRKIKQLIHSTNSDEKIHTPIAIVFTKLDRLSPEERKKSTEELLDDYPELRSSLNVNHDKRSLEFFKVFVESKLETKKEAELRVKEEEEKIKKVFDDNMKSLKQQIDTAIEQAVSAAEKQARAAANQNEEQIQVTIENTRKNTLAQYADQLGKEPPKLENKEEKLTPAWKVNTPLKYSDVEYSKLISWILDINHGK